MERKIIKELVKWKKSTERLPLILQGARQIGKTYAIESFGKQHFNNYLTINFESNLQAKNIFDGDLIPNRIINELSILYNFSIDENTLLFFDEIQSCERALTALKYFAELAPHYSVIAAGSLLGVAVHRTQYSFPVGKVILKNMYPLDFEEFLWAISDKKAVEMIYHSFENNVECSLHTHFLQLYRTYLCTGGMPKAVSVWRETEDWDAVQAVQKNIVDTYIADMAKYASPFDTVKLMASYKTLPAQLAKENKKFQYKLIKSGARAKDYETTIDWLLSAGIILSSTRVSQGFFPLAMSAQNSIFKIYSGDVGLLLRQFDVHPRIILTNQTILQHVKGALTENYVAQTLISKDYPLYYWESEGKSELDFVLPTNDGNCIPVEVKSSENVRSKSLNQFIIKYNPPYSIRISTKNFGFDNNIKSVPLYACFCL